jgi:hypothetical protein
MWRAGVLAACFAIFPLHYAAGWGSRGHSIVAEIAQRRLEPSAQQKVKELLGADVSLASIASWADEIRLLRPDTYNWHFVDIPYEANGFDPARDCKATPKGDCVVNGIQRLRQTLIDPSKGKRDRAEALMFLVHFVGDIHQPLHCAERNGDKGGNQVAVTFFGQNSNLHKVWDFGLIDRRTLDWSEYVMYLEQNWLPGHDVADLEGGEPADWAWEAHQAAVNVAYALPGDLMLAEEYYEKSLPTVDRQLALAGVRLARLLNEALRD